MKTSVTLITFVISWGIITVFGTQFGIKGMIGLGFAVLIAMTVRDYLEAGEIEEHIDVLEQVICSLEGVDGQLEEANTLIHDTVFAIDTNECPIPINKLRDYQIKFKIPFG